MARGELFLVATPIGNLGDVSRRAVEVLASVDLVVCEDTRRSRTLFAHLGLSPRTASLPAFDEKPRVASLVEALVAGGRLALVTDAGSPGICDPGEALVAAAREAGVAVTPVPGPCAAIAALSASGLASGRFHFAGFLPRKASEALAMLEEVRELRATLVLYEAPGRVAATLALAAEVLGAERRACVARELTKLHEAFLAGSLAELRDQTAAEPPRGEVVLVISGAAAERERWSEAEVDLALDAALGEGASLRDAARDVARRAGWSKRDVYARRARG